MTFMLLDFENHYVLFVKGVLVETIREYANQKECLCSMSVTEFDKKRKERC